MRDASGLGLQPCRPVRDERRTDSSLVLVLLVEPEGSISHVSPAHVIAPVAFRVPRLQVFSPGALEGTGSIVRAEEEQSVLGNIVAFL